MSARQAPKHAKAPAARRGAPRRILIVDDHPLTRYGMARLLEQEADLVVCGEAGDAHRALAAVSARKPDLVLTDLTMPGRDGLGFIKDLHALHPQVAVLVVSMHEEELYAEGALRAGARGYIMKNEGGAQLIAAVRRVLSGKTYLSEKMSAKLTKVLAARRGRGEEGALGELSEQEFEVFLLLGQGLTTREIGRRLRLSGKSVEAYCRHVREKLRLKSGRALIQYAVRWAGTQGGL